MDYSAILSTQGLLLTLVSLLGTLFYVHLSTWRKDLIKLKAKWAQNREAFDEEERKANREVRYELPGVNNYVTPLVTGIVTFFILLVAVLSGLLWSFYCGPVEIMVILSIAGGVFLALYLTLATILLVGGLRTGRDLSEDIARWRTEQHAKMKN